MKALLAAAAVTLACSTAFADASGVPAVALDWWLLVPSETSRTERGAPAPMVLPTVGGGELGVAGAW
jgi:hypothetical protein